MERRLSDRDDEIDDEGDEYSPGDASRFDDPVTVTPDEAFQILRTLPDPTVKALHPILVEQGHKISESRLYVWSQRYDWATRLGTGDQRYDVSPRKLLQQLADEGRELNAGIVRGLQNRTIARLAREVEKVKVRTPADMRVMVEVVDKIGGLVHAQRGVDKSEKASEGSDNVSPIEFGKFKTRK